MKMLFISFILFSNGYAKEIMDIGNLDVKGNMDLPKYQMQNDILSLQSSLQKIAKLNYEENNEDITQNATFSSLQREDLTVEDMSFDLKIQKVRLD